MVLEFTDHGGYVEKVSMAERLDDAAILFLQQFSEEVVAPGKIESKVGIDMRLNCAMFMQLQVSIFYPAPTSLLT